MLSQQAAMEELRPKGHYLRHDGIGTIKVLTPNET